MPTPPPAVAACNCCSWDLSSERAFVETLFCQRLNFFLLVFGLVIAASASTPRHSFAVSILWFGFVLCTLLALTVYRNFVKLDWLLKELHAMPNHPLAVTGVGVARLPLSLFPVNPILGYIIPGLCCLALFVAAVLSCLGKLA